MNKVSKIKHFLSLGHSVPDIAKRLKIKPAYVYTVRWKLKKVEKLVPSGIEKLPVHDEINSPEHYLMGGIEVIDFIEAKNFNYRLGNVIKYLSRHTLKGGVEDLKKAQWYLAREIEKRV